MLARSDGLEQLATLDGLAANVLSVLVVDDDSYSRKALQGALRNFPCRVIEAASGLEALRQIAQQTPHLVILDLRMPVLSGLDVLRELRESPACESLPVVVMSGATDRQVVMQLKDLGISGFLVKPLYREEVMRRLEPVIAALLRGDVPSSTTARGAPERPKAVVADADDGVRAAVQSALAERFDVVEAASGIEAHDLIEQTRPALVVVGSDLPLLGERALLQLTRSRGGNMSFVLLGADRTTDASSEFDAEVPKTVDSAALAQALRRTGLLGSAADRRLYALLRGAVRSALGVEFGEIARGVTGQELRLTDRAPEGGQPGSQITLRAPGTTSALAVHASASPSAPPVTPGGTNPAADVPVTMRIAQRAAARLGELLSAHDLPFQAPAPGSEEVDGSSPVEFDIGFVFEAGTDEWVSVTVAVVD